MSTIEGKRLAEERAVSKMQHKDETNERCLCEWLNDQWETWRISACTKWENTKQNEKSLFIRILSKKGSFRTGLPRGERVFVVFDKRYGVKALSR